MTINADADPRGAPPPARVPWLNDPVIRGWIYQGVTIVLLVLIVSSVVRNTAINLAAQNKGLGLGFLDSTAGFDIALNLIDYPKDASYGRAILVGLVNTLLVAVIGVVFATLIGFIAGIARLSRNWVVARLATAYIEIVRNIPLLLQIFFWYFGVLQVLPAPKASYEPVPGWVFLNNRGLILPEFHVTSATASALTIAILAAVALALMVSLWSSRRQMATGQQFPVGRTALILIVALPVAAYLISGQGLSLTPATKSTFNVAGGLRVLPELVALVLALSVYTATYIAEIVRGGILAVSHGQTEAAQSLGLTRGQGLRLVVIPQAMRVIIPPLTNQFLNLAKNSSLAVAIGFPDLVSVGGIVLNQSGHAIEVIAIWMVLYLALSLATSGFMNWYNRRVAIVER